MTGEEKPNTDTATGAVSPPPNAHGTLGDGQGGDDPIPADAQDATEDQD